LILVFLYGKTDLCFTAFVIGFSLYDIRTPTARVCAVEGAVENIAAESYDRMGPYL